ncbi:MAG: ureidoglycolate lyase [Actinobacteria bacterium]|nr:ureidoglycolate lyase [Actinomycetota bacterium]
MNTLKVHELNKESFATFGSLYALEPKSAPTASFQHIKYWKQLSVLDVGGKGEIGVVIAEPSYNTISVMEYHRDTLEALIPLNGDFLLPVAGAGNLEIDKIQVFRVSLGLGVTMKKGCWHGLPLAMGREKVKILVVFADNTSANDLTVQELDEVLQVVGEK